MNKLFKQDVKDERPRPIAFRVQLLPHFFTIEGLSLALPYSADNQRFLQLLEQGRLPWDQLRAIPELHQMCEGKYVDGALAIEVDLAGDRKQDLYRSRWRIRRGFKMQGKDIGDRVVCIETQLTAAHG